MYTHIVQANVIHNNGPFLPWHRLYSKFSSCHSISIQRRLIDATIVRVHEVYLQTECGYTGAQPYWDEMADAEGGPMNQSAVFDPITGFGSGTVDANGCIVDGPFVNLTMHLNQSSNTANFCLSRELDQESFYWANSTYVDECMVPETYEDVWNCWGTSPHLAGHMGVGGTVSCSSFRGLFRATWNH